jgi:putative copper export protein
MIIKSLIIIAFLLIITSLGSALYYMVRNKEQQPAKKTAQMLTIRIGISCLLLMLIFLAYAIGIIKPQGIGAKIQQQRNQHTVPTLSPSQK